MVDVDNIPGLVALMGATGELEHVNRQVLEYTGRTLDELKQWVTSDVVHPEDRPHVVESVTRSIASGHRFDVAQRLRRADGAYRWFLHSGAPVRDANGHIASWCVLLTDIDEQKRAEEAIRESESNLKADIENRKRAYFHLSEAQRLSQAGSFIADLVQDEHDWSDEFYRICEFEPGSKVTTQRVRSMVHPDDMPSYRAGVERALAGADSIFEFRIVTPRGAVKHLRAVAHRFDHISDRPLFVGAVQDVTASKVAEEALNTARSELAHVARITTVSALTASIAHEVSQPLSGIITNAATCLRMLDADPPNIDGARETAKRSLRDGNRAAEVITRLKALFAKRKFALEPMNLNEATCEVITLSSSELQRNAVVLQSELAIGLPIITADRVQLQQVILNLLRNAMDAMAGVDDRPRTLAIRTQRDDDDHVRLAITDSGVGFDGAGPDKLFDAFYTTKSGGMGIGLYVSRTIIERHNGRLWAEPNGEGPGATFCFSVPRDPRA